MKNIKIQAAFITLFVFTQTATAETKFVTAQFSDQLENGITISGALSAIETLIPEGDVYRIQGALYSSEIGTSELTVVVPVSLIEGFSIEQGSLSSDNTINYSYRRADGPQAGTTYHFLQAIGLEDDKTYPITIVDDPHPCLGKVAVGALFLAACGSLHIYNTQTACEGGGVEFNIFGLSCSAKCTES